jgi:galactokinase
MDESQLIERLIRIGMSAPQAEIKARLFERAARVLPVSSQLDEVSYFYVPGRIEFLGKHTDYAGGRSLICTLERGFCVVSSARRDAIIRITDVGRNDSIQCDLRSDLAPTAGHWSNYPMTVASRVARNFPAARRGADIAFVSDLPPAAGLSSSSALVVAIFCALEKINDIGAMDEYRKNITSTEDLAGYLGTVENGLSFGSLASGKGVGTFGGSQDHTAILCCESGKLSQYSFCPVRHERTIALPADLSFVIGVCGISAAKTGDALEKYNRVSRLASEALAVWNSATGRTDATLMAAATSSSDAPERMRKVLEASTSSAFSPSELAGRFEQCWIESTEIIPAVAQALSEDHADRIGIEIDRSQRNAERFLGNQVPETIALARTARELGAIAASAFGAGFGGSVWAMVSANDAERFKEAWAERYWSTFPDLKKTSQFFVTGTGPAKVVMRDEG